MHAYPSTCIVVVVGVVVVVEIRWMIMTIWIFLTIPRYSRVRQAEQELAIAANVRELLTVNCAS